MRLDWRARRPAAGEFLPYFSRYIEKVPDGDVVEILGREIEETAGFLRSIPADRGDHRYGPDKWTIKEVVGHLTDVERVFAYRAMRFSRGDEIPVEGFDENSFVANAGFSKRELADLVDEFEHLRLANIAMFAGLDEVAFSRGGLANNNHITVRALAFISAGHEIHHREILRDRYLK